jgi:hypothetical protein
MFADTLTGILNDFRAVLLGCALHVETLAALCVLDVPPPGLDLLHVPGAVTLGLIAAPELYLSAVGGGSAFHLKTLRKFIDAYCPRAGVFGDGY